MANDPLGGLVMTFIGLASGVSELGDVMGVSSNNVSCSSNVVYDANTQKIENPNWGYVTCGEYSQYLLEQRKKSGSLFLIR